MAQSWVTCPHCQLFFVTLEDDYPSHCPGCNQPLPLPAEDPAELEWYYIENKQKSGPAKLVQLQELIAAGRLRPTDMVLEKGTSRWVAASTVGALFPADERAGDVPGAMAAGPAGPPVTTTEAKPALAPQTMIPLARNVPSDRPGWFYVENQQKVGPVGLAELRERVAFGLLKPSHLLLPTGSSQWIAASTIEGLFAAKPPPKAAPVPPVPGTAAKLEPPLPAAASIPAAPSKPQLPQPAPVPLPAPAPAPEATPAPVSDGPAWFYIENKRKVGPVGLQQLKQLIVTGTLRISDVVLPKNSTKWVPVLSIQELFPKAEPRPEPVVAAPAPKPVQAPAVKEEPVRPPTATEAPAPPARKEPAVPATRPVVKEEPARPPWPAAAEHPAPVMAAVASAPVAPPPGPKPPAAPAPKAQPPVTPPVIVPPPIPAHAAAAVPAMQIPSPLTSPRETRPEMPTSIPFPEPALVQSEPAASPAPALAPVLPEPESLRPAAASPVPLSLPGGDRAEIADTPALAVGPESSVEDIIARFESAWMQGKRPELEDYLPFNPQTRQEVLPKLVLVDFHCRLNCKEAVRVESYLERFPQLANDREAVLVLLELEISHRRRGQPDLSLEEYGRRFPQYATELSSQLQAQAALSLPIEEKTTVETRPAAAEAIPGSSAGPPSPGCPAIPGHEIVGQLGRGSMGTVVYKARHLKRKHLVAVLRPDPAADPPQQEQWLSGWRALARLHHPGIVQVEEVGEDAGQAYCSLELVEGPALDQHLDGRPQPARESAELVEKLADAVHYAHQQGIVHRDLKPANVLLQIADRGSQTEETSPQFAVCNLQSAIPKITGFSHTSRPATSDTPSYLAPEQAAGKTHEVAPSADVYALGAIFYEMLTGRPPFKGASPADTLSQIFAQDPVPPSHLQPSVPRELDAICLKCLQKDPQMRYASAEALAQDLRRFLAGKGVTARPGTLGDRLVKFARRQPREAALAAAVILVTVVGFLFLFGQYRDARREMAAASNAAAADRDLARDFQKQAGEATRKMEQALQAAATARDSERTALENEKKALEGEKAARAGERKALESEEKARENERKALDSERKWRESEIKAREAEKLAQQQYLQAKAALEQLPRDFHRHYAEQWEKDRQWAAAAYHLGRLIELSPKDEKLLVRRADAYRHLGEWLSAAADYSRALDINQFLSVRGERDRCLARSLPGRVGSLLGLLGSDQGVLPGVYALPEALSP
jgi:tetratricopeptide (TPR) repeat protein